LLRSIGVIGPLEVRAALIGVKNMYLICDRPTFFGRNEFRQMPEEIVEIGPVTLVGTVDGGSISDIANAMKPELSIVWRDAGLLRDPLFDTDGVFQPARGRR